MHKNQLIAELEVIQDHFEERSGFYFEEFAVGDPKEVEHGMYLAYDEAACQLRALLVRAKR